MVPLGLPVKPLRYLRPVSRLDEKRNRGFSQRLLEVVQLACRYLLQAWSSKHKVKVAAVVAAAVHTTATGPNLYARQMLAQQRFEEVPVSFRKVQPISHRSPVR